MDNPLIILFAGIWIGLTKGGFGGPVAGAFLVPLLSQRMTVQEAIGFTLPLLMFADLFAMRFYWREQEVRHIRLMLPAGVVGMLIGTLLLTNLPDMTLRRILGVITLIVAAYKLLSDYLKNVTYKHRNWHGYAAGLAGGLASALANAGGPPVTAYLLLNRLRPTAFIGTAILFFFIINWLKVPGFIETGVLDLNRFLRMAWVLPVIPVCVWIGRRVIDRMNPLLFERIMLVLLVIISLTLLFDS